MKNGDRGLENAAAFLNCSIFKPEVLKQAQGNSENAC